MSDLALRGSGEKSSFTKWYERVTGSGALQKAKAHAISTGHAVRSGGESIIVGGALGAIEAQRGSLDVSVSKTNANAVIPIDGAVAVVGLAAGIGLAGQEFSGDLINAGAAAAAIFSYRKTKEFVAKRKAASTVHGDGEGGVQFGEDPILAAARRL